MDLNDEAIAALREEVALQRQSFSLSFVGLPADCAAAVQDMQDQIQVLACHAVDKPPPPPHKHAACPAGHPVVWHGSLYLLANLQLPHVTPPTDKRTAVMLLEMCHVCDVSQSCHAPLQPDCMQIQCYCQAVALPHLYFIRFMVSASAKLHRLVATHIVQRTVISKFVGK